MIPRIMLNISYGSIKPELENVIKTTAKEYEAKYIGGKFCFASKRRNIEFSFNNLEYAHLFANRLREMDCNLKIESICEV